MKSRRTHPGACLLAALLIFAAGCGPSNSIDIDGETRKYALHVPATYSADEPLPLLVALHQFSDTAQGMADMTGLNALADARNFIVAYPQGRWRIWNTAGEDGDADARFIIGLIDALALEFAIDPARIYATGASAGAVMAQYLLTKTDRFAAIAPVMGTMSVEEAALWTPLRPTPIIFIHGKDDPVIPYAGGETNASPGRTVNFLSAEENARSWARKNGCAGEALVEEPCSGVTRFDFACESGADVLLYAVAGGGAHLARRTKPLPRLYCGRGVRSDQCFSDHFGLL